MVVGQRVPDPNTVVVGATVVPSDRPSLAVASGRPSSFSSTSTVPGTGTWNVPGSRGGGGGGGGRGAGGVSTGERNASGRWGSGTSWQGARSADEAFPVIGQTGTRNVPGCGTFTSARGVLSKEGEGGGGESLKSGGGLAAEEGCRVGDDDGPVLVACGQGRSLYDVKGFLSSWVLAGGGDGAGGGGSADGGGEKGGGNVGGGAGGGYVDKPGRGGTSWVLRSESSTAGDGGVVCSACVPSAAAGDRGQPRMLITGGKDSVLREWWVEHGQPRLVAEIPG